jgi:hypothetical protein
MPLDAPVVAIHVASTDGRGGGDEPLAGGGRVAIAADVAMEEAGAAAAAQP